VRIGFFIREALRALRRSAAPSLAAALTVLLTAVVLGVFIPIVQATTGTANEVRGRVVVDVYVKDGTKPGEVTELRETLAATPNVAAVDFISKQEALAQERERNPEAFELLGDNPLPDAFRITPEDPDGVGALVERLQPAGTAGAADTEANGPGADRKGAAGPRDSRSETGRASAGSTTTATAGTLAAIGEVRNREEDTDKILSATGLVKLVTAVLAALLIVASIALVANTIRLSIFARRREIEVMRLVGATNWFIRWPFVIEGVVVGMLGGAAAVLVLYLAKVSFVDPLSDRFALLAAPETIDFGLLVALLLAACMVVAAVGSGVTLRRFLRV
jgi:cell division transport system permease protein